MRNAMGDKMRTEVKNEMINEFRDQMRNEIRDEKLRDGLEQCLAALVAVQLPEGRERDLEGVDPPPRHISSTFIDGLR
jgi:hypothetical protein